MKWVNVELREPGTDIFREELTKRNVTFETSDAGYGYTHFEVLCDSETTRELNNVLNTI